MHSVFVQLLIHIIRVCQKNENCISDDSSSVSPVSDVSSDIGFFLYRKYFYMSEGNVDVVPPTSVWPETLDGEHGVKKKCVL